MFDKDIDVPNKKVTPPIEVPSEDCISRKWIMSRIRSEYLKWLEDYDIDQILGDIEDAPSVIPQTEKPKIRKRINKPFRAVWLDDNHNEIRNPQTDEIGDCNICRFAGCSECDDCINGSEWVRMVDYLEVDDE